MINDSPAQEKSINSKSLNLLMLNAQSVAPKKASLNNLLSEYNPDIIAVTETWLKPDVLSSEFLPSEYNVLRKDRPDGYGGVLLACRKTLNCKTLNINTVSEALACQLLFNNNESLIVCAFYRPPNRSLESITSLCNFFKSIVDQYPSSPIWFTGDLNLPNIDWETNHVNGSNYPNSLCELIIDFILEYGFTQTVNSATREENILDVFFTNRPSLVHTCHTIPGISDHEAVLIESSIILPPQQTKLRKIILWNQADTQSIKESIEQFSTEFFEKYSQSTPVDILWEEFRLLCIDCISSIPTRSMCTIQKQPWITSYIRRLSRKKKRLYKIAKQTNSPHKWQAYKNLKKEVQQKCRAAYQHYITSLTDETGSVTKRLWSYIKSQRKDSCNITSLKHNDVLYNEDHTKAKLLNNYFTSVYTPISSSPSPSLNNPPYPDISELSIDVNGVAKLMQELDASKAPGPDRIPSRFLKLFYIELAPILTVVFQSSIYHATVPQDWKQANIVPIFKKGDHTLCQNYRPVSLTSVCSKLLEHILYSHIYSHLSTHNILCDEQHGFRHARSCESQLITTVNDFAATLNNKGQTDAILLDFSKAFDRVSHQHLYHKLNHYGIRGNLLEWVKHFLSGRCQQVIVNGEQSDPAEVTSGVPQGTVLAPLLFLCFINDLPDNIISSVKLYADDVILYRVIHSEEDCHHLQQDLQTLQEWATKWDMSFNIQKCEFLRITNKINSIRFQYKLNSEVIREATHSKYLGVTIDSKLSWSQHIREVISKANKVKGFLQRNLRSLPMSVKANCFKSLVKPILEYACVVWAPHTQKDISNVESVQRRAARFVFNDYSYHSSVTEMLHRLNWPSLSSCRDQLKAITMFKIVHNLIDISPTYLTPVTSTYNWRGHPLKFQQPATRTDSYLYSFFPSAIKIWNALPDDVILSTTLNQFKSKLAGLV